MVTPSGKEKLSRQLGVQKIDDGVRLRIDHGVVRDDFPDEFQIRADIGVRHDHTLSDDGTAVHDHIFSEDRAAREHTFAAQTDIVAKDRRRMNRAIRRDHVVHSGVNPVFDFVSRNDIMVGFLLKNELVQAEILADIGQLRDSAFADPLEFAGCKNHHSVPGRDERGTGMKKDIQIRKGVAVVVLEEKPVEDKNRIFVFEKSSVMEKEVGTFGVGVVAEILDIQVPLGPASEKRFQTHIVFGINDHEIGDSDHGAEVKPVFDERLVHDREKIRIFPREELFHPFHFVVMTID